ncbi:MAG: hypothetical protein RML36_01420 [Anaerolineae bacterium]|nr:hypothetical protein [Anaerolineae bacterium]MDW8098128.1 hypothetical protein [Anaerolineae bacterium]
MAERSETNDLSKELRQEVTQEEHTSAGDSEPAGFGRSAQPTAELESLDAELIRRIVEDSQSAAPDRLSLTPLAQPAPIASELSASDAELDDAALAAAIFVPPLD